MKFEAPIAEVKKFDVMDILTISGDDHAQVDSDVPGACQNNDSDFGVPNCF